jgi:lycopene beta-cyclase
VSSQNKPIPLDIAIIGGGSAGMALATKLDNLSATVFEPKTAAERDCSWALWAQPQQLEEFSPAIRGSWDQWRLIDHSGEIIHQSNQYRYTSLSSGQYLQHCEAGLRDSVSLVRAPIESIESQGIGGQFSADGQTYSAKTIYDSRPPILGDNSLRQHFVGWEISTKEPIENADIATLMDFRVDQSRGLHFIYVLPYSDRHLLVESTMISTQLEDKDWYRNAISQWLTERNIQIQSKLREEYGVIPMVPVQPQNAGIACIGAAGGAVRLSSGYGFSTIQAQMTVLAESIAAGEYRVPTPFSKRLIFMDKVFNRALKTQPDHGVELFMATAKTLNGEQFSRFMLGNAGLIEWAKVVLAMPKWPFIKSALIQFLSHD